MRKEGGLTLCHLLRTSFPVGWGCNARIEVLVAALDTHIAVPIANPSSRGRLWEEYRRLVSLFKTRFPMTPKSSYDCQHHLSSCSHYRCQSTYLRSVYCKSIPNIRYALPLSKLSPNANGAMLRLCKFGDLGAACGCPSASFVPLL